MKNTILFLTLVLLLASCAVEGNNAKNTANSKANPNTGKNTSDATIQLFDQETFDVQRRLWQEQDLQDYSFDVRVRQDNIGNLCSGTVIVKNGE